MKKTALIFLMLISSITMIAQTKKYYCEVKGIEKELSAGLKIVFDFGNNPVYSAWSGLKNKQKLVDEKGEEITYEEYAQEYIEAQMVYTLGKVISKKNI